MASAFFKRKPAPFVPPIATATETLAKKAKEPEENNNESALNEAKLSAAMAARANAALGGTTAAGDGAHRTARLLVEAGNALAPDILLPSAAAANDTALRNAQPLDLREFLSPLSTFGYALIRDLLERTNDEALRTINVDTAAQLAQCTLSPRSHDDQMLRTPQRGEPVCARGERCEATKLRFRNTNTRGKPAMAYWPPHLWEQRLLNANSDACFNQHNRLCLLCLRLLVTEINTMMMAAGTSQRYHDVALVDFYNAVDVPGEYRLIDTIGAGRTYNGLPGNIVAHDRAAFILEQQGDVWYYRQVYPKPGTEEVISGPTSSSSINALLRRAEQEGFSVASPASTGHLQ